MTPLQLLWFLSATAALAFFASGYYWARRGQPASAASTAPPSPLPRASTKRGEGTGQFRANFSEAELEKVLRSLSSMPGMKAVVLADDLGLPIAAVGDHAETLAAFAGFVDNLAEKSRSYLPLGRVHRVTVADDARMTVAAHPTPLGDGSIALVTLTTGEAPSAADLDRVLRSASRAVSAASERRRSAP